MLDFPFTAYENDPNLKFKIDFVTPRTVRIRMLTTPVEPKPAASIMLAKEPGRDGSWKVIETNDKIIYSSDYGTIQINKNPWRIVLKDKAGRIFEPDCRFERRGLYAGKIYAVLFCEAGKRQCSPHQSGIYLDCR